jgi:superfamily II DNA or RNA helicase
MSTVDWEQVADNLDDFSKNPPRNEKNAHLLDESQRASLAELANRIRAGKRMALIADEVGMGKTRIAAALIAAVGAAGGRAAIVLPPGLGVQWQSELQLFSGGEKPLLPLRSYEGFIAGFAKNEDQKSNKQKLANRRLQRELPEESWMSERVLMISHRFATMRFPNKDSDGKNDEGWRRLLLRWVRTFCGRANLERRIAKQDGELNWRQIGSYRAAEFIASQFNADNAPQIYQEMAAKIKTKNTGYYKGLSADEYKAELLPLIGMALGSFDLVVIDEAHKYRGENSSLSRILGNMLRTSVDAFCVGMTATPVELDAEQWINTIERINLSQDCELESLKAPINDYVNVVKRVQTEVLDESLVAEFECKAVNFKNALGPYVIRRDKRDDPDFVKYIEKYRRLKACLVKPNVAAGNGFSLEWLRRMAAAEALSLLPDVSVQEKRKRIQLAQGLGLIGNSTEADDDHLEKSSKQQDGEEDAGPAENCSTDFWIEAAMSRQVADIYSHPSILEAVRLIESYALNGQKVLVFGVFIEPLKALAKLLDARAMLRALDAGDDWSEGHVGKDAFDAVNAALNMQGTSRSFETAQAVDASLKSRFSERARDRKKELDQLKTELSEKANAGNDSAIYLMDVWVDKTSSHNDEISSSEVKLLFAALDDIREPTSNSDWSAGEFLETFENLVDELLRANADDRDASEKSNIGNAYLVDRKFRLKLKEFLDAHLENYSGKGGQFAMLMHGGTELPTRRNMQAAFNRPNSNLKVLLAQSQVGREGLNLQESCKTIVMLHSEWNPAVVEQQIGRVDRKKSLWLKEISKWEDEGKLGVMPTINIHPIVFAGTYGEHNWKTLETRWASLRAQLHGDVLGGTTSTDDECQQELRERVRKATPRFSPLPL